MAQAIMARDIARRGDSRKSRQINVRLTLAEASIIDGLKEDNMISTSDAIRALITRYAADAAGRKEDGRY